MSRTIGKATSRLVSDERIDRADVDHLVHRRGQRDRRSGHRRDARAPHAAGDDDVLGLDPALVGDDGADRAAVDLDVEHLGVGEHGQRALVDRLLAHQRARLQRVDDGHARRVVAAEHDVGVDERHQLGDLGGRQQTGVDAPRPWPTSSAGGTPRAVPPCGRPRCRRTWC